MTLIYPGANRSAWYGGSHPTGSFISGAEKVVLHCTETTTLPGYSGGASAPHLTAVPDFVNRRFVWYQHFSLDMWARALRNAPGGVETNRDGAIQVEIVGTCDRTFTSSRTHLRMWNLPDWAVEDIGAFVGWCHTRLGIPLTAPSSWPRYPSSPTLDRAARMSGAQWNAFRGVCGHLHVPESTHLDPGDIDIARILRSARGDDVALTAAQTTDACEKALRRNIAVNTNGSNPAVETISVADFLRMGDEKHDKIYGKILDLLARVVDVQSTLDDLTVEVAALTSSVATLETRIDGLDVSGLEIAAQGVVDRITAAVDALDIRVQ